MSLSAEQWLQTVDGLEAMAKLEIDPIAAVKDIWYAAQANISAPETVVNPEPKRVRIVFDRYGVRYVSDPVDRATAQHIAYDWRNMGYTMVDLVEDE